MNEKLCEVCEVGLQCFKCEICNRNICESCKSYLEIRITNIKSVLYGTDIQIGKILICENCKSKLGKINPKSLIDKDTQNEILDKIKKNFIVINFEENDKSN